AFARLHTSAVCVQNRNSQPIGGTGFSVSYNWLKTYDIDNDATKCACDHYRNRNTGSNTWDTCPDCAYDNIACNSPTKHIGGDEFTYYCEKKCGAEGAEAN
ncbi:hypothetical protein CCHL11_09591, partial [Colletotrichum chlorophyti]